MSKVLIIGTHRSGTTNLFNSLAEHLNLSSIEEPFNYYKWKTTKFSYPNDVFKYDVVKSLVTHIPFNFSTESLPFIMNYSNYMLDQRVRFMQDIVKRYKTTILLTRKDRKALAESYYRQLQYGDHSNWHVKYTMEDVSTLNINMDFINTYCDFIETLGLTLKINVTYYEDLYSGNENKVKKAIDTWNLPIETKDFMKYVDPYNRYRQNIDGN